MRVRAFRTGTVQTLATILLVALFVHFGNWQGGKAERQREIQSQFDSREHEPAITLLAGASLDPAAQQFRRVIVRGRYVPEFQVLLDNQIQGERAGYHVLTPLRIADSDDLIYVNRGWIPASANRAELPDVPPPAEAVEISGDLIAPPKPRWLAAPPIVSAGSPWPKLWQSFEIADIQSRVPGRVAALVVRLDERATGGYERQWTRFDSRVGMHQSYAYQWYGLSLLVIVLYLVAGFRAGARPPQSISGHQNQSG